mmetsp:Transcript_16301/g.34459  ORF Transcript_16301/g.34459 Transcript_16301/m.34459 type:complete len:303 (-) Transcript_16301:6227-7135(-)
MLFNKETKIERALQRSTFHLGRSDEISRGVLVHCQPRLRQQRPRRSGIQGGQIIIAQPHPTKARQTPQQERQTAHAPAAAPLHPAAQHVGGMHLAVPRPGVLPPRQPPHGRARLPDENDGDFQLQPPLENGRGRGAAGDAAGVGRGVRAECRIGQADDAVRVRDTAVLPQGTAVGRERRAGTPGGVREDGVSFDGGVPEGGGQQGRVSEQWWCRDDGLLVCRSGCVGGTGGNGGDEIHQTGDVGQISRGEDGCGGVRRAGRADVDSNRPLVGSTAGDGGEGCRYLAFVMVGRCDAGGIAEYR